MIEDLWPVQKVAALFSRSEQWVWAKCKSGEFGTVVKDGGGWLIPVAGIQRYLERHSIHADRSQEETVRLTGAAAVDGPK